MSVQAMKCRAIEFMAKPFRDQELLDAVHVGLARDAARLANETALAALCACFGSLTPREQEVIALVISALLYVLLDGFDLGVGMLFALARDQARRAGMMRAIAPIWNQDRYLGPSILLQSCRWIADSRDRSAGGRLDRLDDPFRRYRCEHHHEPHQRLPERAEPGKGDRKHQASDGGARVGCGDIRSDGGTRRGRGCDGFPVARIRRR